MNVLKQIAAVTLMNIKSVPQRLGASSVIVIGIAGVVGVLVSILAMVGGLSQMMTGTGRADRAIVVSAGASFETLSNITAKRPKPFWTDPESGLGSTASRWRRLRRWQSSGCR
jgi:hypothetical protein